MRNLRLRHSPCLYSICEMAQRIRQHNHQSTSLLLITALGIVYGDIGTSPLYALREAFHGPHAIPLSEGNIFGILSLITWALLFVISFKYLGYILKADNKGEGGVLALTALALLQKNKNIWGQKTLFQLGLFGAALMVSDSMLTPAISVLSAVEGLTIAAPNLDTFILPITFIILIALFYFQHKGTAKIGVFFGPIMLVWFSSLALIGVYSIIDNPYIFKALNPYYAFQFWQTEPSIAFIAMSAVFLVTTGGEALYADMGHLGRKAISNGWFFVALPSLLLNYFGQGALLLKDPASAVNPFFLMGPSWSLIPLLFIATLATIIASQAVISGLFSMASQCIQLGYAPRLKIVHTSEHAQGQIYVPAVNWIVLIGTLWLVIEFKTSSALASAYGISISITMIITSILTLIVARTIWQWPLLKIIGIFSCFLAVDTLFFSANIIKVADGGWVALLIAAVVMVLMTTWKKGRVVLFDRLRSKSYSFESLLIDLQEVKPARVSGSAIFMVGDAEMTPPTLLHNIKHNKVLHETVIFLTILGEDVAFVPERDKIQIKNLGQGFYRVTGHYGFSETPDVMSLINKCEKLPGGIAIKDPTFFLGREILVAGSGVELSFWRKILFSFLAKNAASANSYYKLPLDRVIEVGMQIEL